MDVPTLEGWLDKLGFDAVPDGPTTLRLRSRDPADDALPPFFAQCTENWLLLSMLPMIDPGKFRPEGLGRRLLAANREMRVVKYALDKDGAVVLCAELPTESLDYSELADAVKRMTQHARVFRSEVAVTI